MNLYPEMNEKIVGLLRLSGDPKEEYAAALIEALRRCLHGHHWVNACACDFEKVWPMELPGFESPKS